MNKKDTKIFIILLCIPIFSTFHRILDNFYLSIDLFVFKDIEQDVQWYVKDIADFIILILLYKIINLLCSRKLKKITNILFYFSILNIPLYFLFYLRIDYIIYCIAVILLLLLYYYEKNSNSG